MAQTAIIAKSNARKAMRMPMGISKTAAKKP
jgi:hypothetical protein